ncbi:MAG: type II toxin-antitoxin system VapC family toxin [Peptococcaceae bacterium]|nr:type II toxin-antitoxin system VapC family toxin [Peptococcaceae bacterium]
MKILVDTNIIIDHLRKVPQASRVLTEVENGSFEGLISVITVLELRSTRAMTDERFETVRKLLDIFDVIPVNLPIAQDAGRYVSKYRASHGLEPVDAIIAATASVNDAALYTVNYKHFRFIEGLIVVNPYAC